jgi:hypothetical protein
VVLPASWPVRNATQSPADDSGKAVVRTLSDVERSRGCRNLSAF